MDRPTRYGISTLLIVVVFLQDPVWCIDPPADCDDEDFRFKRGDRYEFSYEAMTSTGLTRDPHATAGTKLTCNLILSVIRPCELIMELLNCHLDDRGPERFYSTTENSDVFAEELSRHQVFFQYTEGTVIDDQILVSELEPLHIINIKRGIISLLQMPVHPEDVEITLVKTADIFGSCTAEVTFSTVNGSYVQTYRDLVACNLVHVSESQANFLSKSKTLRGGHRTEQITDLSYPFESEVTCDYELGKQNVLKTVRCLQRQAHIPLTYEDQHTESIVTNISQAIRFLSKTRIGNRPVDRSLSGKRVVKLAMEFQKSDATYSSDDLDREMEAVMVDYMAQGQNNKMHIDHTAQSFRKLIQIIRHTDEVKISLVKDAIFACRRSVLCYRALNNKIKYNILQSIKERLFINSLMSCGTNACMNIVSECLKLKQIDKSEGRSILFNLALFHQPSSKFIRNIFEYCQHEHSSECLLAMSAMISRLNDSLESSVRRQVVGSIVFDVLTYLHKMIIQNGMPLAENKLGNKERMVNEENLLAAVKSVGNIGLYVHKYYDDVLEGDKKITVELLSLVKSKNISVSVARASVQAISSFGLTNHVINEFSDILSDEQRPLVLRASIFDELLIHGNETVMMKLVKLLQDTPTENLRTYIVSKVSSLNEGQQTNDQWRQKLYKLVEGLQLDEEDHIWSKSQNAHFSHTVVLPLTPLRMGSQVALNILYAPTSNLFHSLSFKAILKNGDEIWTSFEVVVDIEGMDDVVQLFKSKLKNSRDGSSIIKDILSLLQSKFHHKGKTNTFNFTHYSKAVKHAIQHIIALSNFQTTTLPRAYVFLRLNGYDVGWVSLSSCLATLSQMPKGGNLFEILMQAITQNREQYLLHAVKLFDFQKVLPTVAGYPLSTTVDAAVVFKSILDIKYNPVPKSRPSLDVVFHPSITAFLHGSMQVTVGGYSTTQVASKISGFTAFDLTTNVQHHSVDTIKYTEHLLNLTWKLGNEQVKFLSLKSDLFLMHNDIESKLSTQEPEKKFVKCLPDIYNLITGRRFCLHGSYHGMSKSGFYNFMNAFRLSGRSATDDEGLSQYTVQGHWKRTKKQSPGHQLKIQLAGLGTEVSRTVNIVANIDNHFGFKLECSIPDAGIVYVFQRKNFLNSTHHHHMLASVLQQESKTLSSLQIERKGHSIPKIGLLSGDLRIPYNQSDSLVHFNIGLGSLSLDIKYRNRIHSATYSTKDFIVKYHCEPKLKFLYAFHPVIRLAAAQDHTSTFSYHQETSDSRMPLDKTWKAFYKFIITWPDQKIETTTEMVANLQFGDRTTHLTWKYGNEVDDIHMTSHVNTKLSPEYRLFDYSLSMNNSGKFDMDMMGHVLIRGSMPSANVTIRSDVRFVKRGDCTKIEKTKLLNPCQKGENKGRPLSFFDEIQVSFLHWLRGCEYTLQNNCQKWLEKDRYLLWWKGCDLPVLDPNCRVAKDSEASFSLKNSFWMLDSWNFGLDVKINVRPHKTASIAGPEAGLLTSWETNSTWPRAAQPFVATNGSLYMGRKQWIKFDVNDHIHDMMFTWQAEQLNTPEVFQHDHSWTLVETSHHSYDRSFKIHILLVHYQHFDYNLAIRSPRTNVTHYINYTKISEIDHAIRAKLTVHSNQPRFDINYLEATDIHDSNLSTHMEMFSTLLNYEFNINKQMDKNGFKMASNLSADSPMFGPQRRTIAMTLVLQKTHSPRWDFVYSCGDESGLDINVEVKEPKQIRLSLNKLTMDKSEWNSNSVLAWTINLVEPKVLLHTLELHNLSPTSIQQMFSIMQRSLAGQVRHLGQVVSQNIKADFKDKVRPILNEGMEKNSSMAVDILKTIWLDIPLVQAVKVGHIDEVLATSVQLTTQGLSHWILHPPFFINIFMKTYVHPNLLVALEDQTFKFSQHLFVNMQTFMQFPKISVAEKKLLTYIKHKLLSPYHEDRDVAVIVDGRRIKTFDGVVYDITEPPLQICTYLMSCDFKHGSFTLTYTKTGLTLSLHSFGLTLAHDGSIFSFGRENVDYLPYFSSDGHLHSYVSDGEFHIDVDHGLVHLIFNPIKSYYIIAVDRHLNNATLGLLGTNNFEKGDDFLLFNGTVLANTIDLQNGYELSRHSRCKISSPPASISCMTSNDQQCSLFSLPEIQSCNILINSQPFKLQCHVDVCQSISECRSISSYLSACLTLGLHIPLPSHCQCGDKLGLELVIVQSLYQKLIKANDPLLTVKNLLSSFETDVSIGLVTYGGAGHWRNPRAHLLNGKLFHRSTKVIHDIPFNTSQSLNETSAVEAIKVAANYPFQSKHSKIVVLVYQHVAGKEEIKPSFLSVLRSKGITLVAVSTYPSFEEKQALGLVTDGKTIGSKNVTPPEDYFSSGVKETKGMWVNLDAILGSQENQIRKIIYELTKLKSVNDRCPNSSKDNQAVDGPKQEV